MNKRLRSVVLMMLIAAVGMAALVAPAPSSVRAQSGSATDLAKYFSPDTVIYASIRTDDAYLELWDQLIQKVLGKLPAGLVPAVSLRQQLTAALRMTGLDYEADIRSWLGDWAAVGTDIDLLQGDVSGALLLAAQVKDRAKAEAFAEKLLALNRSQFDKTTEGPFTVYRPQGSMAQTVGLLIGDDALFLGTSAALAGLRTRDAKLSQSETFTGVVGLLPEKRYNILAYFDAKAIIDSQTQMIRGPRDPMNDALDALTGPLAIGATLLDDRSLVLDAAVRPGNRAALEALGLGTISMKPIKPAFAANLPANSTLVMHSADLKLSYETVLRAVRSLVQLQGLDEAQVNQQITMALRQLTGLTGIDLEADVFGWMSGDYALFASYEPPAAGTMGLWSLVIDPMTPVEFKSIEAGLVVEATDAAKAASLVAKLDALAKRYLSRERTVTLSQIQVGGANATVIGIATPQFTNPIEFIIGANNNVLVIATRKAGEAILSGQGGFDKSPKFAEAVKYALPNATSLLYADKGVLDLFVDIQAATATMNRLMFGSIMRGGAPTPEAPAATATAQESRQREMQAFAQFQTLGRTVTGLLSTTTISTTANAQGDAVVRFVITLGE